MLECVATANYNPCQSDQDWTFLLAGLIAAVTGVLFWVRRRR